MTPRGVSGPRLPFHSPYSHGFVRVAVATPSLRVADPEYNLDRTLSLARHAAEHHAILTIFPELGISAYSNDDLFHQDALLGGIEQALAQLVEGSRSLSTAVVVGAPLRFEGKLFNTAVVIHAGRLLGLVPKTYLPTTASFTAGASSPPGARR